MRTNFSIDYNGTYVEFDLDLRYSPGYPGSFHNPPEGPEVDVEVADVRGEDGSPPPSDPKEGWEEYLLEHHWNDLCLAAEDCIQAEYEDAMEARYESMKNGDWD